LFDAHQHAGESARHQYGLRRDARRARLHKRFALARRMQGRDVVVLHDRHVPGRRANIDHLAIGPAGITVIDSKNYKGKVAIRAGKLFVNGHNRTKLVYGAKHQCDVVRTALANSSFAGVPIDAALAWVDADGLPLLRTLRLDGVLIDGTRKIVKHASRPGPLSIADIDQLAALLNDELPPARV
jgi:hypothetical protein